MYERYRTKIKNLILKNLYKFSVARSEGVIFLSKYSKEFLKSIPHQKLLFHMELRSNFIIKKI